MSSRKINHILSALEGIDLRHLRQTTDLTMYDMAERMGLCTQRIGAIERARDWQVTTVIKYLKALE